MIVKIASRKKVIFYRVGAESVSLMTGTGNIGILKGHVPVLAKLKKCDVMVVSKEKGEERVPIDGGFLHFHNDEIAILVPEQK